MTRRTRRGWAARPSRGGTRLDPARVIGLAFHWPAMARPLGRGEIPGALRGWQDYHQNGRGWSDIAYQEAVDQWGDHWILRGLSTQSAANGDADVNGRFGALLLLLAPGEQPSPAMVATVRRRVAAHRRRFPRSRRLVGHDEIRPEPTACPGPAAQAAIESGRFEPRKANRVHRARLSLLEVRELLADVSPDRAQVSKARVLLAKLLRVLPER